MAQDPQDVAKLEKRIQLLEKKLARADRNRALLEQLRDRNQHLMLQVNTELTDTQSQLVMQEKMASLGSLVAGVAHEINNPVGAMNAASDVASRCVEKLDQVLQAADGERDPKIDKFLGLLRDNSRVIVEGSCRVGAIVKSLKNFARLDEADLMEADVHEGIDNTLVLLASKMGDGVTIQKNYAPDGTLRCYPQQLNQVFMNLLSNAREAIEGPGSITITTQRGAEHFSVAICDTGKGIAPADIGRIFDPGFTRKSVGVGTGLGLSITHKIVENHQSTLQVASELGKGTTFTLKVPYALGA